MFQLLTSSALCRRHLSIKSYCYNIKKLFHTLCVLCVPYDFQTRLRVHVQNNIESRSRDIYCRERAMIITYSKCVSVVLLSSMQCTCAMLYCLVTSPAVPYFSQLPKRRDFWRNVIKHKMCAWFSLHLPETFFLNLYPANVENMVSSYQVLANGRWDLIQRIKG